MTQMDWQPLEPAPQSNGQGAVIKSYKGFDKDFSCRGHQYEIGKMCTHDSPARCAESRYHSCEMPIDTWSYCGPATSRYAIVVASGQIDSDGDGDSKIASTELVIEQEIELPDLIKAAVRWVLDRASGNIVTSGRGHAAATDFRGRAVTTGKYGHAVATDGSDGHAVAMGWGGHAVATGGSGRAATMGNHGHAATTGAYGHSVAMGDDGHAAVTGAYGHAVAIGHYGHAVAMGDSGCAVATGYDGYAVAAGYGGRAAATGDRSHAAVKGKNSVAAALGFGGTAEAGPDGWIVLSRWSEEGELLEVRAAKVGTEGIEPGKRYRLTAAGFEEAD